MPTPNQEPVSIDGEHELHIAEGLPRINDGFGNQLTVSEIIAATHEVTEQLRFRNNRSNQDSTATRG